MTNKQFDGIAKLLRLRSPPREAARLVLVEGMRAVDAAALSGCSQSSTHNTVKRIHAGMAYARQAVLPNQD